MASRTSTSSNTAPVEPVADDGPDLGADEPTPVYTQADMDAALAAEREAAAPLTPTVIPPVVGIVDGAAGLDVAPPEDPTYEPMETDADGVTYAATIVAVGPGGVEVECTPKAFRLFYAVEGYKAHPLDAQQHLGLDVKSTRRSRRGNAEGTDPELATAPRRRRRAAAAAD